MTVRPVSRAVRATVVASLALALCVGCSADGTDDASPAPSTPATTASPTVDPAAARKAPDSLTVTCSASGATLSSRTVRATAQGVTVTASTKATSVPDLGYLAIPADGGTQFSGLVELKARATTLQFPAPPGRLRLTCLGTDGLRVGEEAEAIVYDPDEHFRAVDVQKVLGCEPKVTSDGAVTPLRSTSKDALDRLAAQLGPTGTVTLTDGPGYPEASGAIVLVVKRDKGFGTAVAEQQSNGAWIARITAAC